MSAHKFPPDGTLCIWCNTSMAAEQQTACPGPQGGATELRPEPSRRQYAIEDFDIIGARLGELEAERTAAMNEPAKD